MKYTKRQQVSVNAGITLCIECKTGYNGDKSCGSSGMIKLPKTSTNGCFSGEKIPNFKGENCLRYKQVKTELSKLRYNTGDFLIQGETLVKIKEYVSDSNFLADTNCVVLENCSVKPLENISSATAVLELLTDKYIQSVIDNNEIIEKQTIHSYKNMIIYFTQKREIIINEKYAEIFKAADVSIYDEKSESIYHFIDICPEQDKEELMLIGLVKRILGTRQLYENIKTVDEFLIGLPYPYGKEQGDVY